MYTLKAIRFVQNDRVFYTAVFPAADLVSLTAVDVWDPDQPEQGYQRAPSLTRKRQIARYVTRDDAIMPVGGLINARPPENEDAEEQYGKVLEFTQESGNESVAFGSLTIPSDVAPLYIVDMQHRLGGFEEALKDEESEIGKFPLVVTISDGLSRLDEVDQFDLINTEQKKVRTDLARRLKVIQAKDYDHRLALDQRGKLWEAKGPVIADILNKQVGVWQGGILPPNKTKRDQPTMVVRETGFVTSLKPVLQTPYFVRQNEEDSAVLVGRYWEAVAQVFPGAFQDPNKHVIQKSPGIFSLHELAPEVFELARDQGSLEQSDLYRVLESLNQVDDGTDFWHSDNLEGAVQFGNMKGFRILASILRQYLPNIDVI